MPETATLWMYASPKACLRHCPLHTGAGSERSPYWHRRAPVRPFAACDWQEWSHLRRWEGLRAIARIHVLGSLGGIRDSEQGEHVDVDVIGEESQRTTTRGVIVSAWRDWEPVPRLPPPRVQALTAHARAVPSQIPILRLDRARAKYEFKRARCQEIPSWLYGII